MLCYLLLYPSGSISNRHSNWYECGPIFRISKYISEGTYDEVNKHTKWVMTLGSVIPQNVLSCYSLLLFLILSPFYLGIRLECGNNVRLLSCKYYMHCMHIVHIYVIYVCTLLFRYLLPLFSKCFFPSFAKCIISKWSRTSLSSTFKLNNGIFMLRHMSAASLVAIRTASVVH